MTVCPQILAAGIEMPAARLETGKDRELAPGEAGRCVPRGGGQQLARGGMQGIVCEDSGSDELRRRLFEGITSVVR